MANLTRAQIKEAAEYLEKLEAARAMKLSFSKSSKATLDLIASDDVNGAESFAVDSDVAVELLALVIRDCEQRLANIGVD